MELLYELIALNTKIKRDFEHKIAEVGLTYPKWIVLKTIKSNEGIKACDLKDIIGMDKATLSELLNRLVKEGCVVKKNDKNDRRISRLYLSESILTKCTGAMCIEQDYFDVLNDKISKDEMANLTEIIQKLNS